MKKSLLALVFVSLASAHAGPPPKDFDPTPPRETSTPSCSCTHEHCTPSTPADEYVIRENTLSTCYSVPEAVEPSDVVADASGNLHLTVGYVVRNHVHLVVLNADKRVVFEKTIVRDDNRYEGYWGPSGVSDREAREQTVAQWTRWSREHRQFFCPKAK